MMVWPAILYGILFVFLLCCHQNKKLMWAYPWGKLGMGLCFFFVATLGAQLSGRWDAAFFLLPAFTLSAGGDVALGFARANNRFHGSEMVVGSIFFAIAHILFYIGFSFLYPPVAADFLLPLLFTAGMACLMQKNKKELRRMWPVALVYSYFVGLLWAKSATALVTSQDFTSAVFFLGATMFFASDLLLYFLNYRKANPRYLFPLHLGLYYLGILLLAVCLRLS